MNRFIATGVVSVLVACGHSEPTPETADAAVLTADAKAPGPGCDTIEADKHYRCAFTAIPDSAEFLFTKLSTHELHAGSLDATFAFTDTALLMPPSDWMLLFSAASPDRQHVLLTMVKPTCATGWPDPAGTSCAWGRLTLWLASRATDGLAWDLVNLRDQLGENSAVVGWSTWMSNRHAVFNAKSRPADQPLVTDTDKGGDAYEVVLDALGAPTLEHWSALVESPHCFIGRMHATAPNSDTCTDGEVVVMTRRCDDEPVSPSLYAIFNNTAVDGSGASCRSDVLPTELVPVFRNYVVEVDASCKPKAFDRTAFAHTPDYLGRARQMGTGREWGEGQATISHDGSTIAFWTMRGYAFSNPDDPCAAFANQDASPGNGAARVRTCHLDGSHRCVDAPFLPPPASAWDTQQQPYFYRGHATADLAVLTTEGSATAMTNLVTGDHRVVFEDGFGGYPLEPR